MKILAIESSCDETAAAVVEDGRNIISSVVASQVEEHKLYGGVVPEIASRRHAEAIVPVVRQLDGLLSAKKNLLKMQTAGFPTLTQSALHMPPDLSERCLWE